MKEFLKKYLPAGVVNLLRATHRVMTRRYFFLDEMRFRRICEPTRFHFTTTYPPDVAAKLEELYGVKFACLDAETNKSIANFKGRPKYPELLTRIRAGSRVLDLGCGPGVLMHDLRHHLGCTCVGLDVIPGNVERLRELGFEAYTCDLSNMFDERLIWASHEQWDYVICTGGALQNFAYPTKISEIFRRSILIYQIYNTGYWFHRLRLLTGRFPYTPTSLYNTVPRELFAEAYVFRIYWTLADFRDIFAAAGFDTHEFAARGLPGLDVLKWSAFFELKWRGDRREETFPDSLARVPAGSSWKVKNAW